MKKLIFFCKAVLLALTASFFWACVAPVNTTFESARTLGTNNMELMGAYSHYLAAYEGETETVNNNYGVRLGYGLGERTDLKFRYEYLNSDMDESGANASYLELYPKFNLIKNRLAAMLPVGVYLYGDKDTESTFVLSPRVMFSHTFNQYFEVTLGSKVDIYLEEDADPALGFNLGFGVGKDVRSSLVVRPEVGLLFDPQDASGKYWSFGIGLSYPIMRNAGEIK